MYVTNKVSEAALKSEIMLQINQRLLERGVISREVYEAVVTKIVIGHPEVKTSGCCCLQP